MIEPKLRDINALLGRDEEILWSGRPESRWTLRQIIPSVLLIIVFAVVIWLYRHVWDGLMIWIIVLLALLSLRQGLSVWSEIYAITNRRVLIFERVWPRLTHSIDLTEIQDMKKMPFGDIGTVRLFTPRKMHISQLISANGNGLMPGTRNTYYLRQLADASHVQTLISRLTRETR